LTPTPEVLSKIYKLVIKFFILILSAVSDFSFSNSSSFLANSSSFLANFLSFFIILLFRNQKKSYSLSYKSSHKLGADFFIASTHDQFVFSLVANLFRYQ